MNDALQQGLHHEVNDVRRRRHLAIRCVESIQTLKEAHSEDRQQLETHISMDPEETVWGLYLRQKIYQTREAFEQHRFAWSQWT
jgi:hypothetical protein